MKVIFSTVAKCSSCQKSTGGDERPGGPLDVPDAIKTSHFRRPELHRPVLPSLISSKEQWIADLTS